MTVENQEFEQQPQEKKSNRTLIIILVVVAVLILCCCLAIFVGPLIFGPAVGNVFSNIVEGLEVTPGP
jgi:hypothetical protein